MLLILLGWNVVTDWDSGQQMWGCLRLRMLDSGAVDRRPRGPAKVLHSHAPELLSGIWGHDHKDRAISTCSVREVSGFLQHHGTIADPGQEQTSCVNAVFVASIHDHIEVTITVQRPKSRTTIPRRANRYHTGS